MSRISFSSPSGTARLRGSERAYAGILIADLTYAAFSPTGWEDDPLFRVTQFQNAEYGGTGGARRFKNDFRTSLLMGWGGTPFRLPGRDEGEQPDSFTVSLNTVLAMGNDPICLLAHLHGQCELHGWVDGPNRAWLAAIIEQGRATGILRDGLGWEAVSAFLRSSASEPVVTSYSVTDSFPNSYVAGYTDDKDGDGWYDLPHDEQWDMALARLRTDEGELHGLEMRPDRWRAPDFYFGDGDTAFSILEEARSLPREGP